MYRVGFAAVSTEGQSLWMYADSNKERNALGTGDWRLERAVDGWLIRVEKPGSRSRLPSLNSARDDRARHRHPCLLTGSPHLDSEQFLVIQPLSQPQKGL